jgi:hypothetical protein
MATHRVIESFHLWPGYMSAGLDCQLLAQLELLVRRAVEPLGVRVADPVVLALLDVVVPDGRPDHRVVR